MTNTFDAHRAIREEISGLLDTKNHLVIRIRIAEEAMGKAESELNSLRKIGGFLDICIEEKFAVRNRLEREMEAERTRNQ